MKCKECGQLLFAEATRCMNCGTATQTVLGNREVDAPVVRRVAEPIIDLDTLDALDLRELVVELDAAPEAGLRGVGAASGGDVMVETPPVVQQIWQTQRRASDVLWANTPSPVPAARPTIDDITVAGQPAPVIAASPAVLFGLGVAAGILLLLGVLAAVL